MSRKTVSSIIALPAVCFFMTALMTGMAKMFADWGLMPISSDDSLLNWLALRLLIVWSLYSLFWAGQALYDAIHSAREGN